MKSAVRVASGHKIAKRYALAFFGFAQEKKSLEPLYKDLDRVRDIIGLSEEFHAFLQDPAIPFGKFKSVLEAVSKSKFDSLTWQCLDFLKSKERLDILKEICIEFEKLYFEYTKALEVTIISARELNPEQINAITKRLKSRFNNEINHEIKIDPRLIGGFKIQAGDVIYDFSIENQLEKFKNRILNKE